MKTVKFDHHDPDFVTTHREKYEELRTQCPVGYSAAHDGFWVLSKYEDVVKVARDDVTYSSATSLLIPPGNVDRLIPLQTDPPETERYRLALMPYFSPRAVALQEPALREDVATCLANMVERGGGDIMHELGVPVPARMTMRILGLPQTLAETFAKPIHDATFSEPGSEEYDRAEATIATFDTIIADAVDARRVEDAGDLISDLLHRPRGAREFTGSEVIDLVRMIIFGGMDTVTGAIGNITAMLAQDPGLQEQLRRSPQLIPSAVEEFLRFEAPIQGFARTVTCPAEIRGQEIGAGQRVWLNWGAANHDPDCFDEPHRLDITRGNNRHLTFGIGKHHCLGARLARMELRNFLEQLVQIPRFELDVNGIDHPRTIGQLLGKQAVHIRFLN